MNSFKFFAFIVFALIAAQPINCASHWSYNNVDKWPGVCPRGELQSPINLETTYALEKSFNAFQFMNYSLDFLAAVKNNKHTVEIRLKHPENAELQPIVQGGSLPNKFVLDSMHFHWQSEHTINGRRYPMELHVVLFDSSYGSLLEAKKVKGGIAVLGVMYTISPDDDSEIESLVEIIDIISKKPDKDVTLRGKLQPKNLLPRDTSGFYRYEGSLTTPGCDEVVIWTVFTNPVPISKRQVKQFASIQTDDGPLLANYRPLQEVNGRPVYLKISPINRSLDLQPSLVVIVIFAFIQMLVS